MTGKAGIKNKLLEAAACGLPIVTTSDGASGLGKALPGITVCNTISEMAGSVLKVLARERSNRQAESLAMRESVARYFSWKTRTINLLSLLADVPAGEER
jgi:glycosyltransferase involved in cell wall biosynthesis